MVTCGAGIPQLHPLAQPNLSDLPSTGSLPPAWLLQAAGEAETARQADFARMRRVAAADRQVGELAAHGDGRPAVRSGCLLSSRADSETTDQRFWPKGTRAGGGRRLAKRCWWHPCKLPLPLPLPAQAILRRLEEERCWRRTNLRLLPQLLLALAGAFLAGWHRGAGRAAGK